MRGEQYTCDKCGQIYFARYTAAASVALFDLSMNYDDDEEEDQLDESLIVTQDEENNEDEYSSIN